MHNFLRKGAVVALVLMFTTMFTVAVASAQSSGLEPGPCDPPHQNPVPPGTSHYTDPATGLCGEEVPSVVQSEPAAAPQPAAPTTTRPHRLAHTGQPIGLLAGIGFALIGLGLLIENRRQFIWWPKLQEQRASHIGTSFFMPKI